ncbi:hypothetical protein GCM10011382_11930 [Vreelandella lutescens]|uniref:Uncharacterized protein n=1 Tax=Vreelandella lutescens TaxID=1602943 RepID=A0ABQ1NRG9_9GAMM|nr:hypothetical protein GCM10011382_11930 [Halomonas lutescens]
MATPLTGLAYQRLCTLLTAAVIPRQLGKTLIAPTRMKSTCSETERTVAWQSLFEPLAHCLRPFVHS